jgi:hypothetical protein
MEQKNNSGSLYKNTKDKPTQPDYTGSATIGGKQYRVSGWVNKSKAGSNYLRILFSEQQSQDLNTTASQVTMPMQPKISQEPVDSVILEDLPF